MPFGIANREARTLARESKFGKKIPRPGEIVKIEGDYVYDADGDKFTRTIVMLNHMSGGGMERVAFSREKQRTRTPKKE